MNFPNRAVPAFTSPVRNPMADDLDQKQPSAYRFTSSRTVSYEAQCRFTRSSSDAVRSPILSYSNVWCYTDPKIAGPSPRDSDSNDNCLDELNKLSRDRRSSLAVKSKSSKAKLFWEGRLEPKSNIRTCLPSAISRKVFVGGLCRDVDSSCLERAFSSYGVESVELWDKFDKKFAYLIFNSEWNVRNLLKDCTQGKQPEQNRFYFDVQTSRPNRDRKVQLIPWIVEDAVFISSDFRTEYSLSAPSQRQRAQVTENTVFVGALHGEMTAYDLALVMSELFGPVVTVGLDTDKHMYPVGTGRVTFLQKSAHDRAIDAEFISVRSNKFSKVFQIDPFIRDMICTRCSQSAGPVFCRYRGCFTYFCGKCFFSHVEAQSLLQTQSLMESHVPLMRNRVKKQFSYR